jgi:hypothetical protein
MKADRVALVWSRQREEVPMVDGVEDKPTGQVRGRPFPKGRSGNPGGRRFGSRNKATMAALELLADEAEALTRKAVEAALAGDPTAMRLCLERILPPIKSAADVARAMGAVTAALAHGLITPAEGQAIAKVVTTFVQTIETSDFDRRLQMLEADQTQQPSSQPRVWPYSSLTT